jgi:hypothetical protein
VYIGVNNIDEYNQKIVQLGGKIVLPRTPVPGWGYLSTCMDTEGNAFGLWQEDKKAGTSSL